MRSRFALLGVLLAGATGCGIAAYRHSDAYHFAQVRALTATYLDRRFQCQFAADTISVQRATRPVEFAFTAPFALGSDGTGTFAGTVRWNGVVYEIDDRLRVQ